MKVRDLLLKFKALTEPGRQCARNGEKIRLCEGKPQDGAAACCVACLALQLACFPQCDSIVNSSIGQRLGGSRKQQDI